MTRHPLDPIAFVGGAIFTMLGVFALFGGDASHLNAGWVWPATLAVIGLVLMALTARSIVLGQRRERITSTGDVVTDGDVTEVPPPPED